MGVDDIIVLYSKDLVKEYPFKHPLKDFDTKNIVLQDNTSTIRLVKGDRRVCGSRTMSIQIRYFYAHERAEDGTIVVRYCPTKELVSNYLSKPLQGSLFQTHSNTLIGISATEESLYKITNAEEKALRAKAANDHLSV